MIRCDAVLFDLDGTLWNATEAIARSWELALADIPDVDRPPTVRELTGVMGMTPEPLMETLFPQLPPQRRMELFDLCSEVENGYLREHGGILYEGVEEMLQKLSQRVPLCVVSNCNNGYISSFLDAHKFHAYFKDWECVGRSGLIKWENIRLVSQRNGFEKPVYVGDTALDQESANKAGVPFIHAAYGFGTVPGATRIEKPLKLLDLLTR